jgi:hypothetical protein
MVRYDSGNQETEWPVHCYSYQVVSNDQARATGDAAEAVAGYPLSLCSYISLPSPWQHWAQ